MFLCRPITPSCALLCALLHIRHIHPGSYEDAIRAGDFEATQEIEAEAAIQQQKDNFLAQRMLHMPDSGRLAHVSGEIQRARGECLYYNNELAMAEEAPVQNQDLIAAYDRNVQSALDSLSETQEHHITLLRQIEENKALMRSDPIVPGCGFSFESRLVCLTCGHKSKASLVCKRCKMSFHIYTPVAQVKVLD